MNVVAAFDVDRRKVGKPLKEAVLAKPNCALLFYDQLPDYPVTVHMGPVMDGVSEHMANYDEDETFVVADQEPCDVAKVLKESKAEISDQLLAGGFREGGEVLCRSLPGSQRGLYQRHAGFYCFGRGLGREVPRQEYSHHWR